jgi:hypothetical protein
VALRLGGNRMSLKLISRLNLGAAFRIDLRLTFVLSSVIILLLWFWLLFAIS